MIQMIVFIIWLVLVLTLLGNALSTALQGQFGLSVVLVCAVLLWQLIKWLLKKVFGITRPIKCDKCAGSGVVDKVYYVEACSYCRGTGFQEIGNMAAIGRILEVIGIGLIVWGIIKGNISTDFTGFVLLIFGLQTIIANNEPAAK